MKTERDDLATREDRARVRDEFDRKADAKAIVFRGGCGAL
jgi:hypothetical protein